MDTLDHISRNGQQPSTNKVCGNQRLTIKHCLLIALMEGWQKKCNMQGDIKTLLERDFEMRMVMSFHKDTKNIYKNVNIIDS